jgi:hypothetical protein
MDLLLRVAFEVRRAHGKCMTLEEVLEFVMDAVEQGRWPEIPGRPYDKDCALAAPSMQQQMGAPNFATRTMECARCDLFWQTTSNGGLSFPSAARKAELLATAGTPGHPRIIMIPRELDPDPHQGARHQPPPQEEIAAITRDGGCRVPGCPHSGAAAKAAAAAGASAMPTSNDGTVARPGLLRAVAVVMLTMQMKEAFDSSSLTANDLITLCPHHLRAILCGGIQVKTSGGQEGVRFSSNITRALASGTREVLKTRRFQKGSVDLEDLKARIAKLEARPPPILPGHFVGVFAHIV